MARTQHPALRRTCQFQPPNWRHPPPKRLPPGANGLRTVFLAIFGTFRALPPPQVAIFDHRETPVEHRQELVDKGEHVVRKGEHVVRKGEHVVGKRQELVAKRGELVAKGEELLRLRLDLVES